MIPFLILSSIPENNFNLRWIVVKVIWDYLENCGISQCIYTIVLYVSFMIGENILLKIKSKNISYFHVSIHDEKDIYF